MFGELWWSRGWTWNNLNFNIQSSWQQKVIREPEMCHTSSSNEIVVNVTRCLFISFFLSFIQSFFHSFIHSNSLICLYTHIHTYTHTLPLYTFTLCVYQWEIELFISNDHWGWGLMVRGRHFGSMMLDVCRCFLLPFNAIVTTTH